MQGATKSEKGIFYVVRMNPHHYLEIIATSECRNKWPILVINYLEKILSVSVDNDEINGQEMVNGNISLSENTIGDSLAICCK